MRRFRVAVAGLGASARSIHLPAYRGLEAVEVVGGADPVVRGGFPFPVFASAEELVEKTRPDILSVLAPPEAHFPLARLGLEAGCHVLCEKPVTSTLDEADALAALSRRVGRRLAVNQEYRFMRIHEAARAAIGRPEFGGLLFLSAEQTFFVTALTEAGWRGDAKERTGREFGIHVLDLCRFFFNEDPLGVTARMPRPGDAAPDRLVLIRLDFPGDRVAQLTLDRLSRGRHRYLTLRLDGTAATIETELGGGIEVRAGVQGRTRRPFLGLDVSPGGRARLYRGERSRKLATEPGDVFAGATRRLFAAFLQALERDLVPPCEIHDNRKSLALVHAAYKSSARGATVQL